MGKQPVYYVQKSYRNEDGKPSTKYVERLGTLEDLEKRFGEEDPVGEAKKYVAELTAQEKENRKKIMLEYNPAALIDKNTRRCYNGGYLFLQKVYHELGLDKMCRKIEKRHRNKYDLDEILQMLLFTRILYPGSKLSSLEDAKRFIEQPKVDIHQVYRALSILAEESDDIQADVYRRSLKLGKRRDKVIYYDCTNYYFESEEENGLRQYGHSKENRPNPIVQMGLFTDMDGIPLAFCVNPGNTAETTTLKPLEEKLKEKFGLSKVVVCTDGGLSSYDNRKHDSVGERSFITVQSLKKLEVHLQDWATQTTGWKLVDFSTKNGPTLSKEEYDLTQLNSDEYADRLFCRERWIKTKLSKTGEELEQRLIVTFSFKYREYLQHIREKQIARAEQSIQNGTAGKLGKGQNDPKRFIKCEKCTVDGEVAQYSSYSLNQEMDRSGIPFRRLLRHLHRPLGRRSGNHKGQWWAMDNRGLLQTHQNGVRGASRIPSAGRPHYRTLPHLLPCAHHIQVPCEEGQPRRGEVLPRPDNRNPPGHELSQSNGRRIHPDLHKDRPH